MAWNHRDLALNADPAQRYLPWLMAMIVFLASLSLAGIMSLDSTVARWDQGLKGTATVQLPPDPEGEGAERIEKVLAVLRDTPGILSARALDQDETAALLEPWLGKGAQNPQLPLPRLIDVKIHTEAPPDMTGLAAALADTAPGTVIDDHRQALDRLIALTQSVELVALVIVLVVALAAVATVITITRTGLALHQSGIELLHLIGAEDTYVARQFQSQALELGLKGGIIGLALTMATVAGLGYMAGNLGTKVLPRLDLTPLQWMALAAVPLAVTAIAMVTARWTALAALRRLP